MGVSKLMNHQCENCDEEFYQSISDANNYTRFCSRDCEQDYEDRVDAQKYDDMLDFDYSMNY
jgi:hypothetical protein